MHKIKKGDYVRNITSGREGTVVSVGKSRGDICLLLEGDEEYMGDSDVNYWEIVPHPLDNTVM